jgi:uncharacterized protein YprB with RNaseH-like and TPR domain/ribosomal protein S27AE
MRIFPGISAYPGLSLKASHNSIICVGWKVLGSRTTHCINAWDFPAWGRNVNDDAAVVREAFDVLKDADAVVTHNGRRFDWKFLQTRLFKHGLSPLPRIQHIDTCVEAKKHLFLFNNRLNTVGQFLVGQEKLENGGWKLWMRVLRREAEAMRLMERYCKHDVRLTEKIFRRMLPLLTTLPGYSLFAGRKACPNCGSYAMHERGRRVTVTGKWQRFQCQKCGSWSKQTVHGFRAL